MQVTGIYFALCNASSKMAALSVKCLHCQNTLAGRHRSREAAGGAAHGREQDTVSGRFSSLHPTQLERSPKWHLGRAPAPIQLSCCKPSPAHGPHLPSFHAVPCCSAVPTPIPEESPFLPSHCLSSAHSSGLAHTPPWPTGRYAAHSGFPCKLVTLPWLSASPCYSLWVLVSVSTPAKEILGVNQSKTPKGSLHHPTTSPTPLFSPFCPLELAGWTTPTPHLLELSSLTPPALVSSLSPRRSCPSWVQPKHWHQAHHCCFCHPCVHPAPAPSPTSAPAPASPP